MNKLWQLLYQFSKAHLAPKKGGHMVCADCFKPIHRTDRYKVLEVKHVDCMDPKLVGQTSMPIGLGCPEPLRTMLAEETYD